jgi:hypothetical protein
MTSDVLSELITTVQHQVTLFPKGSSQHTLQVNRLKALEVAQTVSRHGTVSIEDLKQAVAPLTSLISKSEKALMKLKPDSWQAQRLERNVSALFPILSMIQQRLAEKENSI